MADSTITERLQPSLLDRLTDHEPGRLKERRDDRVIDLKTLREIVQRDLAWLLNTSNAGSMIDSQRYPLTRESVVNFGIREVSGDFSSAKRADLIRASIERAIGRFEPRIRKGSVSVTLRRAEDEQRRTIISYDIHADLWAQPMPMELYLRTDVDITTGELTLERVP